MDGLLGSKGKKIVSDGKKMSSTADALGLDGGMFARMSKKMAAMSGSGLINLSDDTDSYTSA